MKRVERSRFRGFTLVEVVITTFIVAVTGISIIASVTYGIYLRQTIGEHNCATRVAGDIIESVKRTNFNNLSGQTLDVLIDDRGTAATDDDVRGTAELRFFDVNDNLVGTDASPIPSNRTILRVEVEINWNSAAAGRPQTFRMHTLLAP